MENSSKPFPPPPPNPEGKMIPGPEFHAWLETLTVEQMEAYLACLEKGIEEDLDFIESEQEKEITERGQAI